MSFQVAIDGPVAAGKGTVARLVAQRLHFLYIDTGAMYRATALLALQHHVKLSDEAKIVQLLSQTQLELHTPTETEQDGRLITVVLDGEDVSWKIRTKEITASSSMVAMLAKVRACLVEMQQKIAQTQDVVMEGRDISYRVLPTAQLKIYLDASAESRAKRRHFELQTRGEDVTFEKVYESLLQRDHQDMTRAADPLKITEGAWVLDTTTLSIEEVVDIIVARVNEMRHSTK